MIFLPCESALTHRPLQGEVTLAKPNGVHIRLILGTV
jgi:hypothetical protein